MPGRPATIEETARAKAAIAQAQAGKVAEARQTVTTPTTSATYPRKTPTYTPPPVAPVTPPVAPPVTPPVTPPATPLEEWFMQNFGGAPTTAVTGGYPQPTGGVPKDQFGRTATWSMGNGMWIYPPDWAVDPVTLKAGYISPADKAGIDLQKQMFGELSAYQQAQMAQQEEEFGNLSAYQTAQQQEAQRRQTLDEQEFAWRQQQAGQLTAYQKSQLDLARQQLASEESQAQGQLAQQQREFGNLSAWQTAQQQEAQAQYKAQLAANPKNWLEYAAYTGQQPVVQPWMLPLMSQQYGFNAGGEIPGWTAENMTGMPSLLNPSQQYLQRMGPTAQQQLYGYQQAQTGATPEETQWRLWSAAPPAGQYGGLNWAR